MIDAQSGDESTIGEDELIIGANNVDALVMSFDGDAQGVDEDQELSESVFTARQAELAVLDDVLKALCDSDSEEIRPLAIIAPSGVGKVPSCVCQELGRRLTQLTLPISASERPP